jgi:hypothetical protein
VCADGQIEDYLRVFTTRVVDELSG